MIVAFCYRFQCIYSKNLLNFLHIWSGLFLFFFFIYVFLPFVNLSLIFAAQNAVNCAFMSTIL